MAMRMAPQPPMGSRSPRVLLASNHVLSCFDTSSTIVMYCIIVPGTVNSFRQQAVMLGGVVTVMICVIC